MRRFLLTALMLAAIPLGGKAAAQSDSKLQLVDMTVILKDDGSAQVTEKRLMSAGMLGTECYIKFYNLNGIELKDISVRDQYQEYIVDDGWDLDRNRDEKEGHCGINEVDEGLELCWGLGTAGYHEYVVSYTLTNLVKSYSDFDGFNHAFYEAADPAAREVAIKFLREKGALNSDSTKVWGFGYYGNVLFADSTAVEAHTTQPMNYGDKVIVMMQFSKGLLTPSYKREQDSFVDLVKKQAFEGSDYSLDDDGDGGKSSSRGGNYSEPLTWKDYLFGGGCCLLILFPFVAPLYVKRRNINKQRMRLFGTKKLNEVNYYRQIPIDGALLRARVVKNTIESGSKSQKGLIEAYILRLIYKNKISVAMDSNMEKLLKISQPEPVITTATTKAVSKIQSTFAYGDTTFEMNDDTIEYCLQTMLYEAAGDDHLLQPKELSKYMKEERNALRMRPFSQALATVAGSAETMQSLGVTESQQTIGFFHYLRDFSLVGERHLEEVGLWKEYLVYAAAFDIGNQVRKDMKKICPDYIALDSLTQSMLQGDSTALLYDSLTDVMNSQILYSSSYETRAERIARIQRERSSGGGGSSSFGGGGGFSGGGGSGVR